MGNVPQRAVDVVLVPPHRRRVVRVGQRRHDRRHARRPVDATRERDDARVIPDQLPRGPPLRRGFIVIAVPCNQFGGQEPGDPKEIRRFVEEKYGVRFPILSKQNVKGPDKGELFDRLSKTAVGGSTNVKWNFEKFLVNRQGQVVDRFSSITGPDSSTLASAIEKELGRE